MSRTMPRRAPPRIVLVRPKAAENVGAAARAMKNFGAGEMVLVAPRCRLDRRAYALASHAGDVLDASRTVDTLADALTGCTFALATSGRPRSDEPSPTVTPAAGVASLPEAGGAIVFGPEDHGLSNEDLDHCQAVVRIPTADYASVNLAQAVNILCYAWFVQGVQGVQGVEGDRGPAGVSARDDSAEPYATRAPAQADEIASRDQYERMYRQLRDAMLLIGYTDEHRLASILRMYRGFLDRARLSSRELAALRGFWSQAMWAARLPPDDLPGRENPPEDV